MTTALAPAAAALVALMAKLHVPRLISAMLPAGKPAKSAALQPNAATVDTLAVTSPLPEYDRIEFSMGPAGAGETCSRTDGESTTKVWNSKGWTVTS